jgi:hypothetical protein
MSPEAVRRQDRRSGALLVSFVALQIVYLVIDIGVVAPPSPDAPTADLRAMLIDHGNVLRWHALLALASFFGLFLPGVAGLRRRLARDAERAPLGADLVAVGAVAVTVSVSLTLLTVGVLGLIPQPELSDSVLRTLAVANEWSAFALGGAVTALFVAAASLALLHTDMPPQWLARFGLATAGLSAAGTLWLTTGDFHGPLYGIEVLSRAIWLLWMAAASLWLIRAPAPTTTATGSPLSNTAAAATPT